MGASLLLGRRRANLLLLLVGRGQPTTATNRKRANLPLSRERAYLLLSRKRANLLLSRKRANLPLRRKRANLLLLLVGRWPTYYCF